jgi:hypothetical protein
MKIIDQTPFYKANGELSVLDRGKAILQFGSGWFKEVEGQRSVIAVLAKILDKNYTLLVNTIPPGLDARIPLILVGPTGVSVLCVTSLVGTFRARGDQWGVMAGENYNQIKPNLLIRTQTMARAIQLFLQKHGYSDLPEVEAVLLCSDVTTHVDSMRPIIRVVMRDALERFAVSIGQARLVLNPESSFDIVNKLLNPPASPKAVETAALPPTSPAAQPEKAPFAPDFALGSSAFVPTGSAEMAGEPAGSPFVPTGAPETTGESSGSPFVPTGSTEMAGGLAGSPFVPTGSADMPSALEHPAQPARRRKGMTGMQWAFLVGMFVVWCLIVAVFAFIIFRTNNPQLFMPK